jgi:uncharacterized Zn finger protein (UPF0148 family)
MHCPECGSRLECYEGQRYCPNCTRYEVEEQARQALDEALALRAAEAKAAAAVDGPADEGPADDELPF